MAHFELVFCLWTLMVTRILAAEPPGGYYKTKYDYVDIEEVLNHKRLVQHYASCLLNKGPCPSQTLDVKRILPEALRTNCLRCTDKQKDVMRRSIRRMKLEYPEIWKEITDLYDPTGEFVKRFEETYDQQTPIEDQDNLLSNRFGDEDNENNVASKPSSTARPYPIPSTTIKTITTSSPPSGPSTPSTTTTIRVPASIFEIFNIPLTTKPPQFVWRPEEQQTNPPAIINIDAGVRILGSLSDFSSRVIKAGSQVAGMLLSTVQKLVGH